MFDYNEYFSLSSKRMKASKIRELMKFASMPDVISFAGGMPDPDNFPFDDVKNIINNWDKRKSIFAMQYGSTEGYPPLLETLKKRMKDKKSINLDGQSLIVTTGGQQALFLISRVLIEQDDIVLVEEPSFIGAIASFLSCLANLVGIPLERDGVNIDFLENKIIELKNKGKKIKFFYTIPNFQNPAGVTLSQQKRERLYEISKKYNLIIVEDDPYGDLYFTDDESRYKPLKAIGNDAPIVYIGSFSKILCPGFRLGWVVGDNHIIEKVALAKQSVDACSSSFGQVLANDYLENNLIDNYLTKMKVIYKEKKERMIKRIKENFPEKVNFTNPDGGFFIYIDLPDKMSGESLFKKTIKNKVAFVTGEPFHTDPVEGDRHIRLSFSNSSNEQIDTGIKILGDTIKEEMQ